jgi:hypothetical protein
MVGMGICKVAHLSEKGRCGDLTIGSRLRYRLRKIETTPRTAAVRNAMFKVKSTSMLRDGLSPRRGAAYVSYKCLMIRLANLPPVFEALLPRKGVTGQASLEGVATRRPSWHDTPPPTRYSMLS